MAKIHHAYLHISKEQYQALFDFQNGRCAICGTHQSKLGKRLSVDHDHTTNEVRGLLCHSCNVGLGYFRDNEDRLMSASRYLTGKRSGILLSERSYSQKTGKMNNLNWRTLNKESIKDMTILEIMKSYGIGRSTAFGWKKRLGKDR